MLPPPQSELEMHFHTHAFAVVRAEAIQPMSHT